MVWKLQEAKQRFSRVVDDAREHGPQVVTQDGKEVAVVVSIEEFRRMTGGFLLAALGSLAHEGGDAFADIVDEVVSERRLPQHLPRTSALEP